MKTIEQLTFLTLLKLGLKSQANRVVNDYWFRYGDKAASKLIGKEISHNPWKK